MMTEVSQIQFSDVRMQGREPTHQGGARRRHCRSSQPAEWDEYQKPLREPTIEIMTVPRPTCQKPPNRTRRQPCMELSSDVVSTMTVSNDEANKIATVPNNLLQFKIPGYVLNQGKYTRHRQSP